MSTPWEVAFAALGGLMSLLIMVMGYIAAKALNKLDHVSDKQIQMSAQLQVVLEHTADFGKFKIDLNGFHSNLRELNKRMDRAEQRKHS